MNPLLRAHELSMHHRNRLVFSGVSLSLMPGDRLAVMGASGCGKTTLLRLIAGLEKPTGGSLDAAPGLTIGMVFQDLALWPNLTALENVALVLSRLPRVARRATALDALGRCQIAELAHRKPATLSIGQQQRISLARALAAKPQLLLLDEPFSSLDWILKSELLGMVQELASEAAIILVTHDPFEARSLCPRLVVLEEGRAMDVGQWNEVLRSPASKLLRSFTEQTDRFQVRREAP